MSSLTESQRRTLRRVRVVHDRGEWARAVSAGERVTLASLEARGLLERRPWRGDGVSRDSAFEYRLSASLARALATNAEAERVRVVWTDPFTKRTRRYAEPIAERAEAVLAEAQRYIAGAYDVDGREARDAAIASVRIEGNRTEEDRMTYEPGTRVRFTANSLGTVKADGSTPSSRFERETVGKGDAGVVVEADSPLEGWFNVKPDKYPELLVPVVDGFVELEEPAS